MVSRNTNFAKNNILIIFFFSKHVFLNYHIVLNILAKLISRKTTLNFILIIIEEIVY